MVRPVTVMQSPCSMPASSMSFITTATPPMSSSDSITYLHQRETYQSPTCIYKADIINTYFPNGLRLPIIGMFALIVL